MIVQGLILRIYIALLGASLRVVISSDDALELHTTEARIAREGLL